MKRILLTTLFAVLVVPACKTANGDQEDPGEAAQQSASEPADPGTDTQKKSAFTGCEITQFTSGWIEASCENARYLIQPDLAALATIDQTWSTMSKALSDEFEADVVGEAIDLTLADEAAMARSFTIATDKGGEPAAKGFYALWDMGETAKMGAACIQDPAKVDRDACTRGFLALKTHGIPGDAQVTEAADSGASLVLAGQPVILGDDCEFAAERKVSCESGELTWFQGEAEQAKAKSEKALSDMKNVASASGADVTENKRPCTIGEYDTTCRTYDISSDAQEAVFHSALVEMDGETLAVACWYDAAAGAPSACEAVFGMKK